MIKQIRFLDLETSMECGGIVLDNGNCICGCCGGLFEQDEEESIAKEDATWKIIEVYKTWVDISPEIIGE